MKKIALSLTFLIMVILFIPAVIADTEHTAVDLIWVCLAAFLVFFMQAGFAMVEAGLTRAKNAGNIIMKNLMDLSVGALAFYLVGFGLLFGAGNLFFGTSDFILDMAIPDSYHYAFWLFQVMFAATAATIVSGAMAERTKFSSYLLVSLCMTAIIYPISGHWIWGGGWLQNLGFIDFAGSTVVHSVGGWAALVAAILLGPRIGKYFGGNIKAIRGHSLPLLALGVFILWFGWYGFNAGSTLSGSDGAIGRIAITTTLAAAAGALSAMFTSWIRYGKSDVGMTFNGVLAGLVAITAGTAAVSPFSSILIGAIAGVVVIYAVSFIDHLKIDDPVGVVSVHGVCGALGTLLVGVFAQEMYGGVNGLLFGGGFRLLGIQSLGVGAVLLWTVSASFILFGTIKYLFGLRVSTEDELKGLDIAEHGAEAYADFPMSADSN